MLSWYELPDDQRPPEEIWLNTRKVNEHFEQLHRRDSHASDVQETVPMMQNELTKGLRP